MSRHHAINPSRSNLTISQQTQRHFTYSAPLSKKKDKNKKGEDVESKGKNDDSPPSDPFDLTQLHNGISDAIARLKEDLHKLRSGGRFNPEVLENLRVSLSKNSNETIKLGELAQVVPKGGRSVAIIVGEEDLIKPVNSAIIASNLSLTPQPDQHNALQLNVPIPPPTKESREQAIKTAKLAMEKAANSVKSSRAGIHKKLQDMQKKKEARPDDIRKAHDQMEKVVEKAQKDIKDVVEMARKTLEQA
ncbi:ribosome recycling factor-domain-containing protein [Talaromyces proteolyticus]|uniref:Ribosome recycling factor-domain-containing protein n=1 Tax=Talaromyces proteolyticus TaxID=1131652 RepID=A0AAD4KX81_9EURO|nr:ribosome recycling factor-domain-containing protein [Talaromyces proteolyticus]KAH8701148.1 ribosome recycling factor-domain-containing protein [Talaromyces proteolyticus]